LERMSLTEEEKLEERQRLARKEKEFSRLQRHQMTADDFEHLSIVGRGAFGEVRIVREKSTGKLYAMKKLKKSDTVRRNQVSGRISRLVSFILGLNRDMAVLPW
jgi:serine/threonine kinase 38